MASATRWLKLVCLMVTVACVPALLAAADRSHARRDMATPADEVVEMFSGIEKGQIEVQLIPKDSTQCNVLIKNKTDKPLSIKLPEAFAGVPVQAQLGGGGLGGAPGGGGGRSRRGGGSGGGMGGGGGQMMGGGMMGGMGGGMGGMGGGMGGMGGGMGGGRGMGGGMFNVPPEKVGQLKVATVCLEHGKPDPRPSMKYEIRPIEEATNRPAVAELCRKLGSGEVNQRVAQVAAWHLNNDMSWEELAKKHYKYANGMTKPYFTPDEIRAAMTVVTTTTVAVQQSKPNAESASAGTTSSASRNRSRAER